MPRSVASSVLPLLLAFALGFALAGCNRLGPLTLMSTPVNYHHAAVDPFAHLPEQERVPAVALFYATNRSPRAGGYGNDLSPSLQLGRAEVRLGGQQDNWSQLYSLSTSEVRDRELPLARLKTEQQAELTHGQGHGSSVLGLYRPGVMRDT